MKNKKSLAEAMSVKKEKGQINNHTKTDTIIKKKVIISVTPEMHYHLKKLALEKDTNIKSLGIEAINDLFIKYNNIK